MRILLLGILFFNLSVNCLSGEMGDGLSHFTFINDSTMKELL